MTNPDVVFELGSILRMSLLTTYNLAHIRAAGGADCLFCSSEVRPGDITETIDEGNTAVCPRCRVDGLVPHNADLSGMLSRQ